MTPLKERRVILQLHKKAVLERKIEKNKKELLNIKILKKTETDPDRLTEMENKELFGLNLIEEQEKKMEEKFSRLAIAHKVKVNYMEIWELDMREPDNWRRQKCLHCGGNGARMRWDGEFVKCEWCDEVNKLKGEG